MKIYEVLSFNTIKVKRNTEGWLFCCFSCGLRLFVASINSGANLKYYKYHIF